MKTNIFKPYFFLSAALMFCMIISAASLQAKSAEQFPTGLPELTQEELEHQNKHMLKVKKVKLNRLGLERVNKWRNKKGKTVLNTLETPLSEVGQELEVSLSQVPESDAGSPVPQADMPSAVDNSQLKYFPPIRSQGSLNSCGVFNGTYYAMTHMYAMAHDLDAKTGGDTLHLSPKWTYNMVNGGTNSGSWYYWAYEIGQKHGVATWAEFPYDSNYRAWNLNPETWEDALYRRFDQYGYVPDTHTDGGIEQAKQMLLNGYVLNIPTYIYSWNWQTIQDDPSTANDDAFVGKKCVSWVNGTQGYHAMTVVGYNDDIWVDINNNNVVDAGEKGAFRIANSWGTGWGEAGFAWMSYDALKNPSAVLNGPSSGRIYGWYPSRAHWVTAKPDYTPRLIGKFTLNHLKRDHLRITLGVSDYGQSSPSTVWYPEMIYNQGGAYAFNGTTSAVDGTFVFDFTDIQPSGDGLYTYYIGLEDDTAGDPALLKSFTLIDLVNGYIQTPSIDIPQTADASRSYASVDYGSVDTNLPPTAVLHASETYGTAPLAVTFDGSDSLDSDGTIASYHWDFGDGASQDGINVTHSYTTPGFYTATLTVTDDMGAEDSNDILIEVIPDPSKIVYIFDMTASLKIKAPNTSAVVTVQLVDNQGDPVSGAQINAHWSGLVKRDVTAVTGQDGTADFVSKKTRKAGVFEFTVDNITAPGYAWDPSMDLISTIAIETVSSPKKTAPRTPRRKF